MSTTYKLSNQKPELCWRAKLLQSMLSAFALTLLLVAQAGSVQAQDTRPNILLITADDMGYTDLASFGGEIRTPNLDSLALAGVRLNNFHVGPACSQTRTMLMSGTYTEVGGITGNAAATPLVDNVVALPQLMKDAGYRTYMAGKWHLGGAEDQHPAAEGFDLSYALNGGAGEHFYVGGNISNGQRYIENGVPVGFPEGAYSTELYTDKIISYLQSGQGDNEPFFAWYTPTAPHWPIQVPDDYLHLYDGAYDSGYDDLLRKRIQRADQMGILPPGFSLENYPWTGETWSSLSDEEKRVESRKMELYAAMMENFDYQVGRLITYLKDTGQYENTIIIFSSDNGADTSIRSFGPGGSDGSVIDNSYENLGRATSYFSVGTWGNVHSAPFKYQKGTQGEGGIRAPAFIHFGELDNKGGIDNRFITIMDMMPTFLEIAGSEHPAPNYNGRTILPTAGVSFADLIVGAEAITEHSSGDAPVWYSSALYKDQWKLTQPGQGSTETGWLLYDLKEDPSETTNLASQHPQVLTALVADWTRIGDKAGYTPAPPAAAGGARGGARGGAAGARGGAQ